MRTTIDIPDETYRAIRILAAERGDSIRQLVLEGLELVQRGSVPRSFELPVIRSSRPGTLELTSEQIDALAFS